MKKSICAVLISTAAIMGASECMAQSFDANKSITVVSREEGSGTRGAFVELFSVEERTPDGKKKDMTTKEAVIAPKTNVMLTSVSGDNYAVGYVSTGSLNNSIKAVKIDGVAPTVENIRKGTYKIARPFNIATKGEASGLAKDFITFILSAQGQKVVGNGYIAAVAKPANYSGKKSSGKIVVAGSSSVTPIMEKLAEAYRGLNPDAKIEIQMTDSTAGMTCAINRTCDIGMASRPLKEKELAQLKKTEIAVDGIAVIVNLHNTVDSLTKEQVRDIFTGRISKWSQAIRR